MTDTLVPFSASVSAGALPPPISPQRWGGAMTGPARPRPDRPADPAELLRSAVRHALLRDLRRLGEALRSPTNPARQASLRRHVHFLLSELDTDWAPRRRLHRAVTTWQSESGRNAVRQAVLDIESVLVPPGDDSDHGRCGGAAERMFVAAGRPHVGVTRWWWLLEDLDEADATMVRSLLTPGQRLTLVAGRRRARRRQHRLWT